MHASYLRSHFRGVVSTLILHSDNIHSQLAQRAVIERGCIYYLRVNSEWEPLDN